MTLYQKFKKLKIDFSAIEFEQAGDDDKHFCTPKGARIIGSAGVDGIHYCFVRGQEEMVFAVSPMNTPGRNVFPIARSFEDLLRLLLACGSMAALQQVHQWDEEQFDEYIAENQPTDEAKAVFEVLKEKLGIAPMEEPFTYLFRLQNSYNYRELNYSKEYYELMDARPIDEVPSEWRVTIEGDFRSKRGKAGQEIPLNKEFYWGDEHWHIPAAYLCSGGVVIDFCIRLDDNRVKDAFCKTEETRSTPLSYEERVEQERKNPLNIGFRADIVLNGEVIRNKRGRGGAWIPQELTGDDTWESCEEKWFLEHYALDLSKAWIIRRLTFPWEGRRKIEPKTFRIKLERNKSNFIAARFVTPDVGGSISFTHPISNVEHTLTVQEIEKQTADVDRFPDQNLEFPSHFMAITYTLTPNLPTHSFQLKDCNEGDRPRPKNPDPHGRFSMSVGVFAMVRSADGPTAVLLSDGSKAHTHAAASSMHFEPLSEPVEWYLIVSEKLMEDVEVDLI